MHAPSPDLSESMQTSNTATKNTTQQPQHQKALSFVDEDFMLQLEGPHLDRAEAVVAPLRLNMAAAQLKMGDNAAAMQNCAYVRGGGAREGGRGAGLLVSQTAAWPEHNDHQKKHTPKQQQINNNKSSTPTPTPPGARARRRQRQGALPARARARGARPHRGGGRRPRARGAPVSGAAAAAALRVCYFCLLFCLVCLPPAVVVASAA